MKKKLFIFDLDKTITSCDTFIYFVIFVFIANPLSFIKKFIYLFKNSLMFKLTRNIKYKSNFLYFLLRNIQKNELQIIIYNFCNFIIKYKLNKYILKIIKKNHIKNDFIIISASPDIYVKKLAKVLKAKKYFATKISLKKKNYGKIIGKNCFGNYKKKILMQNIKNFRKLETIFYTDSYNDLPLLKFCTKSFIILNKKLVKYK